MPQAANPEIIPLLLCGGVGKRLWPLSRAQHPKQMLSLYNTKTLLQNTLLRLQDLPQLEKPIIVCNKERRFIIRSQIAEIEAPILDVLLEPKSMNTAPAIALSALYALQKYGEVLLLAMPVDHKIDDAFPLSQAIQAAIPFAQAGHIVAFGTKPKSPNTQYGYIEVAEQKDHHTFSIKQFIEKPDLERAQAFLKAGHYYWNTGIFLFNVSRILRDFDHLQPEMLRYCSAALASARLQDYQVYLGDELKHCPNISIDYAIMEKTKNISMVELHSSWTDIGNWQQLYELDQKNPQGNVLNGNIVVKNSSNCYIRSDRRLIATLGLKDCFVIETRDATLIADKNHLDQLPQLVEELEENKRSEAAIPATVHRPWGYYTSIECETHYQVKKIVIHPQQRISLQEHQYRSEHWIILKGKATIILGQETSILHPNQSTFVPIGIRHQIINNENHDLELIEVQMGSDLREDDIKRFDDVYQRDLQEI